MSSDDADIDDSLSVRQDNLLDIVPLYIATGIFLLTIVLATIQVILRQVPVQIEFLFWTEPLARYLLIVMTYLGTAIAIRNDENVKIDLLQRWLQENRPNLYHVVTVLISLFVLYFVYAVLQGAVAGTQDAWTSGTNLPHLTYGMIHGMIAISTALMGIYVAYELAPYGKFIVAKLTGGEYSITIDNAAAEDEIPAAQMDETEASLKAQELMGLSDDNDTDRTVENDTSDRSDSDMNDTTVDSDDQINGDR